MVLWVLVLLSGYCYADKLAEVKALKALAGTPVNTTVLEKERDAKIAAVSSPVKDEFETTAQFEQRKKDATRQAEAIRSEYVQKINAATAAHTKNINQLNKQVTKLLADTRENTELRFTLGAYNADGQAYTLTVGANNVSIVVPLASARGIKENISAYKLTADRQLNTNLEWEYANWQLSGTLGRFTTADNSALPSYAGKQTDNIIPPDLTAGVEFSEPSGNQMLDAEETATLKITLTNRGKGSAYLLEAMINLTGTMDISYSSKVYFGEIKPAQSSSKTLELKADPDLKDANLTVNISFSEQNGFPPDDKSISFTAKAAVPPQLAIADIGIKDFSKNGKIEPNEPVEVIVRIQNKGRGVAKAVIAQLNRGNGVFLNGSGEKDSYNLSDMQPGEYKDLTFNIITAKTATALPLTLTLTESRSRYNLENLPLNLAFNQVQRTADQMVITGKEKNVQISDAPSISVDVEQNIPVGVTADKVRYGVIFGIEDYKNVSGVRFARRDAEYMKEYFIKTLGIPAANVYVRYDQDASLGTFKTVFDANGWLQKSTADKQAEVFFYYSGHGAPGLDSKKAYLIPYDGDPNYAAQTGYDLETLYANLGKVNAKQVTVFLDSCFSGANRDNEILLTDARPVFISVPAPATAANFAVFAASGGSQISSAYSDKQHGLFSYFLMKGMQGAADSNKDKKLTLQELNDYLAEQVNATAMQMGREQNPQLQSGDPQRVLLKW